jgi:hypothetical protein
LRLQGGFGGPGTRLGKQGKLGGGSMADFADFAEDSGADGRSIVVLR